MSNNSERPLEAGVLRRGLLSLGGFLVVLALALFLPAGIGWWQGWFFLAVFVFEMALAALYLWRTNPELFVARSKIHAGTKPWDEVVLVFLILSFMATFPVAGQYHSAPAWLFAVGYVLVTIGMAGMVWAEAVNKFAEPSVRIQTDRGHKVIDTGPYAIVRHPMYVAAVFFFAGIPLALGSYSALIPAALATGILIVRTVFEDRMLQDELPGYKEYTRRVRCRLVPGVW